MKAARKQLEIFLTIRTARSVDRSRLHPGVQRAIETWESFPPAEGSEEYRMARIRLLADMLWSGEYSTRRRVWGERPVCFTPQDLNDARQWLYKRPDGRIARYQSLEHVWQRKDLIWDSRNKRLRFVLGRGFPRNPPNPIPPESGTAILDPEMTEISKATFSRLAQGTYRIPRIHQESGKLEDERYRDPNAPWWLPRSLHAYWCYIPFQ